MNGIPIEQWRSSHPLVRQFLVGVTGNWGKADMTILGMGLQAVCGQCYASAAWLGAQVGSGQQRWDRTLKQLRDANLVRTTRRVRPNHTLGTNVVDFGGLWRFCMASLKPILRARSIHSVRVQYGERYVLLKCEIDGVAREILVRLPAVLRQARLPLARDTGGGGGDAERGSAAEAIAT